MISAFVDPGATTGIAFFRDRTLIYAAEYPIDLFEIVYPIGLLVIEVSAFRRGDKNPQSIVTLAKHAGTAKGYARGRFGRAVDIREVSPQDWKGGTPKAIAAERTLRKLTSAELSLCSSRPNELDAIGIGLWWHKR